MPGGGAVLATQTGAALIPTVCQFTERGWRLIFLAGDPRRGTRPAQGPGLGCDAVGRGRVCRRDRAAARGLAHARPHLARRAGRSGALLMRIGLVCPYQWDVPGGVQYHVRDLARTLRDLGHYVEVLTPAEREESRRGGRDHLRRAHRPDPVQRLDGQRAVRAGLGRPGAPLAARGALRRRPRARAGAAVGLAVGLHDREGADRGHLPHRTRSASKFLAAWGPVVRPWLERISGRIAVSDFARRVQVEHLGGDAVIIPNGVHVSAFTEGPSLPGITRGVDGPTIGFLGLVRRAAQGLAGAAGRHAHRGPTLSGARLLVAGRGDADAVRELIGEDLRASCEPARRAERAGQGRVPALRRHLLRAQPVALFGVVLIEALAAGAPIVASDLDAFARVLEHGDAGVLVRRGDASALAEALCGLLGDPARLAELSAAGPRTAAAYDWDVLARRILAVYETVLPAEGGEVTAGEDDETFPAVQPARMQSRPTHRWPAQH